jgi:hypothetical protein
MVGKFRPIFPMIGKIFRAFSNDWKKFSAQGESKGSARGKRKERKGGDAKNTKTGGGRTLCSLCSLCVLCVENGAPAPAVWLKS